MADLTGVVLLINQSLLLPFGLTSIGSDRFLSSLDPHYLLRKKCQHSAIVQHITKVSIEGFIGVHLFPGAQPNQHMCQLHPALMTFLICSFSDSDRHYGSRSTEDPIPTKSSPKGSRSKEEGRT